MVQLLAHWYHFDKRSVYYQIEKTAEPITVGEHHSRRHNKQALWIPFDFEQVALQSFKYWCQDKRNSFAHQLENYITEDIPMMYNYPLVGFFTEPFVHDADPKHRRYNKVYVKLIEKSSFYWNRNEPLSQKMIDGFKEFLADKVKNDAYWSDDDSISDDGWVEDDDDYEDCWSEDDANDEYSDDQIETSYHLFEHHIAHHGGIDMKHKVSVWRQYPDDLKDLERLQWDQLILNRLQHPVRFEIGRNHRTLNRVFEDFGWRWKAWYYGEQNLSRHVELFQREF